MSLSKLPAKTWHDFGTKSTTTIFVNRFFVNIVFCCVLQNTSCFFLIKKNTCVRNRRRKSKGKGCPAKTHFAFCRLLCALYNTLRLPLLIFILFFARLRLCVRDIGCFSKKKFISRVSLRFRCC